MVSFLTFTEVDDPTGDLSQTAPRSTWTTLDCRDDAYLYRDYGAAFFDDFAHHFTLCLTLTNQDVAPANKVVVWGVETGLGDFNAVKNDAGQEGVVIVYRASANANKYFLRIQEFENAATHNDDTAELDKDTVYYLRAVKNGTAYDVYVYSDSARTILVTSAGLTLQADHTFRYLYAPQSLDFATDGGVFSGYVENLDLDPSAPASQGSVVPKIMMLLAEVGN